MTDKTFEMFGFNWRIGRHWGIAHPNHICWNSPDTVRVVADREIRLDIRHEEKVFNFGEGDVTYPWSVGYVSSIETVKYGTVKVDYILPQGSNLWPAIWMSDGKTWPPEIDIVEAWSNSKYKGKRCYRKVWNGITIPFVNDIFPGVVTGNCVENKGGKSYRNIFKGTCSKYLKTDGNINTCVLDWQKDEIVILWNGHLVAREKDPKVLKWFNESEGMEIHLNNYVTNDFTAYDYEKLPSDESRFLRIMDLKYIK